MAPSGYSDKKNIHQNGFRGRLVPYWDYQKTMVTNSRPQGIAQKSGRQVPVEQLSLGSPGSHFQANFIKDDWSIGMVYIHISHKQDETGPTGPGRTCFFHFSDGKPLKIA